jgi:uncharacterized membrane protein YfcA
MLGYVFALLVGLSLGVLGGGGSVLTVPIFVYVMGFPAKQAIAMSLPVVGATSLAGAVGHWRTGNFDLRAGLIFGALAMVGARVGAALASRVSGALQLTLLGLVMIVAAVLMLRRREAEETSTPAPSRRVRGAARTAAVAGVGLGVGVLTGLVGVGGGFLFVPALVLLGRLNVKVAIGTSLFVIAASTVAGFLGYRGHVRVPWSVVATFTAVALVGLVSGTRLVPRLSSQALRRLFAYFLIVMAAFILYQNRGVLTQPAGTLRPSTSGSR